MTTNILPISNVINVTVTSTPQGLAVPNVNNVAIFTQDVPNNLEVFGEYVSPAQVAQNYGTNSVTAQMANALFSQLPNVLSGDGQLIIIPMQGAVSATAGKFATPNIAASVNNIAAVTNGDLKVTVDGVAQNLANLNFSLCTTLAQIAAVFNSVLFDCACSVVGNELVFTSFKVGTGSTVALATYAGGGTDLTGVSLLNSGSGTATAGANSSGETIAACIARTAPLVQYCGIMTTANLEDTAIEAAANAVQALDNLFLHHCASTQDITGVVAAIQQATETKTRLLTYCTGGQAAANLMKAAYAGRAFSVDVTGSDTAITMNLKTLATILPDTEISQTLWNEAQTNGTDLYVSYAGLPSVVSTGGNDYFDNQYFYLALKFALEAAGFNYLRQTNTKVPQTEQGMNGLKDAYRQVCEQFVRNGYIAPGEWNSAETFGDPVIFNNNIENNGYYIFSEPVALQSSSARQARQAPLVQIAIKGAGAIHSSNVLVIVNP